MGRSQLRLRPFVCVLCVHRNSAGALVPAGSYLCTLTARGADGTQSRAVRAVNVRR